MKTEIRHDPDFPYVVLFQDWVGAKFPKEGLGRSDAMSYAVDNKGIFLDTTPAPKIPADGNYVFVEDGDQSVFAYRLVLPDGGNGWMMVGNGPMNEEELLEYIGDEPVTVMVEKEDV